MIYIKYYKKKKKKIPMILLDSSSKQEENSFYLFNLTNLWRGLDIIKTKKQQQQTKKRWTETEFSAHFFCISINFKVCLGAVHSAKFW